MIFDAEHFFDGYRHNPAYALSTLKAALDAGADRIVLCDTNGGTMPHDLTAAVRKAAAVVPAERARNPRPQRLRSRRGQHHRGRPGGGGHGPGNGERLRGAVRQRRPDLRHRQPPAQDGPEVPPGGVPAAAHEPLLLCERGRQCPAPALPALCRAERLRPQGGHPRERRRQEPPGLRAHPAGAGGQPPAGARLRTGREEQHRLQGEGARHRSRGSNDAAEPEDRPGDQAAGESGIPVRRGRRIAVAPDEEDHRRLQGALHARVFQRDEREDREQPLRSARRRSRSRSATRRS